MIELVGVRLDHPRSGEPLIRRADLAVAGGEVVVIGGAAGIGASRMIAALLGEATIREGTISVLGRDLSRLRRAALRILRRAIGVIPQDLCLLGDRTAILNTILPLEIDGVPRAACVQRAAELLARLGLADDGDRPIEDMAWSSRQRVAVARALIRAPSVIVADQPTSLQDETGAALVCDALASAAAAGAAVLVLGRDPLLLREALRRGWRMMTLDDGYLGARVPDASTDDVSLDMVIEALSAPTQVAGISVDLAIGPSVASGTAAAASEEEEDSDGIPRGVLPFPISARSMERSKPEPMAAEPERHAEAG
jgi:ABC-type ATPase involved in cell division